MAGKDGLRPRTRPSASDSDGKASGFRGSAEPPEVPDAPEISVVIVDERRTVAEALVLLIGTMSGVRAQAITSTQVTIPNLRALCVNIVLIATHARGEAALELARTLAASDPDFQVVLLAEAVTAELVQFVLDHHLSGLLLTDLSAADIAICLDQIARGRAVLPQAWQRVLAQRAEDPLLLLSERQVEVMELLAAGRSYEDIARTLFISVNTVKFHVRSIFSRLGIHNRFEAAHLLDRRLN